MSRRLVLALAVSGAAFAAAPLSVTLQDPSNGNSVTLQSGARALHVVFFATWCEPCRAELVRLDDLEARYGERGYRLVLVGVPTRQSAERLRQFAATEHPPGLLLYDAAGEASTALHPDGLPTHVLLDAAGAEVHRSAALDAATITAVETLVRRH
ncbi:MAG TPA: TlpA disulfide reductase family protein [Candidatus Polarisedimenticolaceae bacterium]|nr:TlpA disulfide reductase family protein [Candidatus Polarisedimenticolaceae bacterium]